jgi:hypothetical protein
MDADLAKSAKFILAWHKYVVMCNLTWPHSKYSHLPNRSKEVLVDICLKLGVNGASAGMSKKELIAAILAHEL